MRLPTSSTTVTLATPTSTPSLNGPGNCFVCGDPSDTFLLIQAFGILVLGTIGIILQVCRIAIVKTMVVGFWSFFALLWLTLIIHATLKFWMDDWATSNDRWGSAHRAPGWKAICVYGITKSFQIFGILQQWLGFGIGYWLVWRLKWKNQKAAEDGNEESEETVVREETPLIDGERNGGSDAGNGESRRFRVRLNGHWLDGAEGHRARNSIGQHSSHF